MVIIHLIIGSQQSIIIEESSCNIDGRISMSMKYVSSA